MIKTILLVALLLAFVPRPADGAYTAKCGQYLNELEKYPWDTRIASDIMYLESRCNPKAVNRKDGHRGCWGSFNVMQVACLHYKKGQDRTDSALNIKIAYRVYQEAGNSFKPWTTCRKVKGCR